MVTRIGAVRENPFIDPPGPRAPSRLRRRALALGGAASGLVLLAGASVLLDARAVRSGLLEGRGHLHAAFADAGALLTSEGRRQASQEVADAWAAVESAERRASRSVGLSAVARLPGGARQRAGLLDLVGDIRTVTGHAQRLLASVDAAAGGARIEGGTVPLGPLADLERALEASGADLHRLAGGGSGLWPGLSGARQRFDRHASAAAGRLERAAEGVAVARRFLGGEGERQYLLAMQNNAEMRDQGMVLSHGLVRAAGGRLVVEPGGTVNDIPLERPAATPVPPGTAAVFGFLHPTQTWHSVNATADFSWSARAMADMYSVATGRTVDGVIAVDVPALAGLLRVVGPVRTEGVDEPVHADNVARLLLHEFYAGLAPGSDQRARRERQSEVMAAVMARLHEIAVDAGALGRELAAAGAGGHLRLWSADDAEERVLERAGLGGGPGGERPDRTFHLAVQNRTLNKLDYFVKPAIRQQVRVAPDGSAVVTTVVTVDNQAPSGADPSYQFGPDPFTRRPGDYLAWLLLWAPAGSTSPTGSTPESGLALSERVIEVAAGQARTVTFTNHLPAAVRDGRLELRFVPQPRLEPVPLGVEVVAEGWEIGGDPRWQGPLDRVRSFDWKLTR